MVAYFNNVKLSHHKCNVFLYKNAGKEIMWIMHRVHRKINVMSLQQEHLKLLNLTISVDRCLFSTLQQVCILYCKLLFINASFLIHEPVHLFVQF